MNKNKKVTIGLIFGSIAFSIIFLKVFTIVMCSIFSTAFIGLISYCILLAIGMISMFAFVYRVILIGYYIESYLKDHNLLKEKEESEDKNII